MKINAKKEYYLLLYSLSVFFYEIGEDKHTFAK